MCGFLANKLHIFRIGMFQNLSKYLSNVFQIENLHFCSTFHFLLFFLPFLLCFFFLVKRASNCPKMPHDAKHVLLHNMTVGEVLAPCPPQPPPRRGMPAGARRHRGGPREPRAAPPPPLPHAWHAGHGGRRCVRVHYSRRAVPPGHRAAVPTDPRSGHDPRPRTRAMLHFLYVFTFENALKRDTCA